MNCPILRLHVVRWGFMLFFFPSEGLSIMQLYCCIWLVGLLRIYSSCVFPLTRGQELPAEVMHAQSWSSKVPCFISCQAAEALISIKNNRLQTWQVVIKVCYCRHSFSGDYRNQRKITPLLQIWVPSCHLQPSLGGTPARSLRRSRAPSQGRGDLLPAGLYDPFAQTEARLAA